MVPCQILDQHPIELVQVLITCVFALELGTKAYVARSRLRFLGQYCPAGLGLQELCPWAMDNWQLERVPTTAQAPA